MDDVQTLQTEAPEEGDEAPSAGSKGPQTPMLVRTGVGVGTACVVVALLAADSLWPQGFVFLGVGVLIVALGLREYAGLCGRIGVCLPARFLVAAGCAMFVLQWAVLVMPAVFPGAWLAALLVLALAVMGTLGRRALLAQVDGALAEGSAVALGLVYVPLLFGFLTAVRVRWGLAELVFVLAVCKGASSAAFFVGTWLGRHKMAPVVSPKKTYEGLAGSLVAALAIAWAGAASGWVAFGVGRALVLGFVVWAAATVGDLAASALKREAAVKDSGKTLPGIGGVIDMVDDILFAAPFGYLVLAVCGI